MDYSQAKKYIDSLKNRGIVPGLDSIQKLCRAVGDPQNGLKIIHIAGTNGKGSTGVFIESILRSAGKSVFRFSSPAVGEYLEMFTINGKNASEEDYALCAAKIQKAEDNCSIRFTSFEAETAIAFLLAKMHSPDYAIIECGLGGRLDSTNIIKAPVLAVITAVSMDHTAFLGNSIEEITGEKCGIIKDGCHVISAVQEPAAESIIRKFCSNRKAKLSFCDLPSDIVFEADVTSFRLGSSAYRIKLLGSYQPFNASLSVKAASALGISNEHICSGLKSAFIPYRFERIGSFILDGAHNPGAAIKLAESVNIYLKQGRTAFICGIFKDKSFEEIADITAGLAEKIFTVSPPAPRGLDSSELCAAYRIRGANAFDCTTVENAITSAKSEGFDNILIFGSLSILGEAKRIISAQKHERDQL